MVAEPMSRPEARSSPDGWRMVAFGQVARNVDVQERNPREDGIERYVGLDHLDPGNLHIRSWGDVADGTTFTRRFKRGQVLFGKRRAYQRKSAVAEFDGICSGDILVFEPSGPDLLPELLPFVVESDGFFAHALRTSAGSLSPRTKWKELAEYQFRLPPKDEQRRIADILWAADAAVERWRDAAQSTAGCLGVLRRMLVETASHPRVPLAEAVAAFVAGRSLPGVDEPIKSGEYGVLKVSAVGAVGFDSQEHKRLLVPDRFEPRFSVRAGDLLITRANTRALVGRVVVVPEDQPCLMLSDKTLRIEVNQDRCQKAFLFQVLQTKELRAQIESQATGTSSGMKNISQAKLARLRIPLPSLTIQRECLRVLAHADQAAAQVERQRKKLLEVRTLLREALLSGQDSPSV